MTTAVVSSVAPFLIIIIIIQSIVFFIRELFHHKRKRDTFQQNEPFSSRLGKKTWSYLKRTQVMNSSEFALYLALRNELGHKYIVLSKVRIEDFVGVDDRMLSERERYGLRSRIKSRHVDFLICDFKETRPLLAIELDGESHDTPERMERDQFVDDVYKDIGLPVEHINVGADFAAAIQKIRERLISEQ